MKRPDTLLYPPALIQHTSREIAKGLRGVFSLFKAARKKGLPMAPSDVKIRGEEVIDRELKKGSRADQAIIDDMQTLTRK